MLTSFCIWWLRIKGVPVMLNIQLESDIDVRVPRGMKFYHTQELKDSGRVFATQEEEAVRW